MEEYGGAIIDRNTWRAQIFPEDTQLIALEIVVEARVELYLPTWFCDALVEDGVIKGEVVESKSGRHVILADTFVDASADSDVAFHARASITQI